MLANRADLQRSTKVFVAVFRPVLRDEGEHN
jgi:hypothetical protein